MCSSWTAEPLVVDTQCQDETQPLCATLEVAPSFGTASWQSPMSSFTFLCVCETHLGSGSLSCWISNKSIQPTELQLTELHTKSTGHCSATEQARAKQSVLGSVSVISLAALASSCHLAHQHPWATLRPSAERLCHVLSHPELTLRSSCWQTALDGSEWERGYPSPRKYQILKCNIE